MNTPTQKEFKEENLDLGTTATGIYEIYQNGEMLDIYRARLGGNGNIIASFQTPMVEFSYVTVAISFLKSLGTGTHLIKESDVFAYYGTRRRDSHTGDVYMTDYGALSGEITVNGYDEDISYANCRFKFIVDFEGSPQTFEGHFNLNRELPSTSD